MSFEIYLVVVGAMVLALLALSLLKVILVLQERRRLFAQGRVITWQSAFEKVLHGDGFLVRNHTSLPGKYWWIPSKPIVEFQNLYEEVKNTGYLVIRYWGRAKKDLKRFHGKVYSLDTVPFHKIT